MCSRMCSVGSERECGGPAAFHLDFGQATYGAMFVERPTPRPGERLHGMFECAHSSQTHPRSLSHSRSQIESPRRLAMSTLDARVAALETALADKSAELDTFYLIWASGLVFLMQVRRTTLFSGTRRNCFIHSTGQLHHVPRGMCCRSVASLVMPLASHPIQPCVLQQQSNIPPSHISSHLAWTAS